MSMLPTDSPDHRPIYEYFPYPLGRLGTGAWKRRRSSRGLDTLDAALEGVRRAINAGQPMHAAFGSDPYELGATVGRRGDNDRIDVAKVETLLGRAGYLDLTATEGPTGYYGARVEDALRRFQSDGSLKSDGRVNPNGPTMAALRHEVESNDMQKAPSLLSDPKDNGADDTMRVATQPQEAIGNPAYKPPMVIPLPGGPMPPIIVPRSHEGLFTKTRRWLKDLLSPPSPIPEAANDNTAPVMPLGDRESWEAFGSDFEATLGNALKNRHGRRGSPVVREANRIVAEECSKLLKEWGQGAPDLIEHAGGAVKDGTDTKELAEKYIRPAGAPEGTRKGSSYPDVAYTGITDANSPEPSGPSAFINSVSIRKDGAMTADERRRYDNLIKNAANDIVDKIDKPKKGESWETYRLEARRVCQDALSKLLDLIRKIAPEKARGKEGKKKP